MSQRSTPHVLAVFVLTATLATTGCLETARDLVGDDDELQAQSAQSFTVRMAAENATEDLSHVGLEIEGVFAHNASVAPPEGYHEMNLSAEHADLVVEGEGSQLRLASQTLPVGTYDQLVIRVGQTDVQTTGEASAGADGNASAEGNGSSANESDDAHDHEQDGHGNESAEANESSKNESGDGHDHEHGGHGDDSAEGNESSADGSTQAAGGFDIPINVTFEVTSDTSTTVQLILDAGASASGESFEPAFTRVEVAQGGEIVEEIEDPDVGFREAQQGPTGTAPPVARMTVFDGDGDKAHQPDFQAASGAFVNSLADPFAVNASLGFSATESEAVADRAAVESYRWDFGDNETATGLTANHSYQDPGAYEVTLTVTDSFGVTDEQTLRIVVASWTEHAINTSFEEGQGNWTVETSSCCGVMTEWELDGAGYESDTAWHAGTDGIVKEAQGYETFVETTLISPNVTIPEDWTMAGFLVHVRGSVGGAGLYSTATLDIYYEVTGNGSDAETSTESVESFSESVPEWTELGSQGELSGLEGKTVKFYFVFDTNGNVVTQEGWYMDGFQLGGIPEDDFRNAELLEEGSGDGHDHEH